MNFCSTTDRSVAETERVELGLDELELQSNRSAFGCWQLEIPVPIHDCIGAGVGDRLACGELFSLRIPRSRL